MQTRVHPAYKVVARGPFICKRNYRIRPARRSSGVEEREEERERESERVGVSIEPATVMRLSSAQGEGVC